MKPEQCDVYIGDLVIYSNRQSLERRKLVGMVMGRDYDGRMLVLWVKPGGRAYWDRHEWTMLRIIAEATRLQDSLEDLDTEELSAAEPFQSLHI